jgi:hypothetical protein
VGYELYLLPVPEGADVEETGEALLVRLVRGHERTHLTAAGRARAEELAQRLVSAEPDLMLAPAVFAAIDGSMELRARSGLQVVLAEHFARFLVPFAHCGDAAALAFHQLFALLAVAAGATGWRTYDPQEGAAVVPGDESRDAALEIYLSVMDQLSPAAAPARRAGVVPA